ncbi:PIN domain nuclease [ANME-1 cluster archaeon AG-394-G06]|nr:PIN domain nuclease [ANME-1 cluster archaeon AG-394-G06]
MIILDTSVVVKWFSEEKYTDKALEIREKIRIGEERVVVPDLLLYELANALKYNPSFDTNDVRDALTSIFEMEMDIVTPLPATINSAVSLAFGYNITVYDAFYVALAKETEFTFITADRKLYERVNDLNFVKFIDDFG